ncbi:hypothetical protein [Aneurinibacillus thermoaerophilus]|uniref:hypothetical protein n=1 Tax=Aneurinibacillus thermoaerophilus TaxID=143495 RepID=UPI002E211EA7|nr:hypothetical protein [Aneurinibacillus thermoaerophilus]MED0737862.1 hypothetical protein [Aneurinibacillus thermoaerophilus]MED0766022.1 hypothetical protein [Aneurinibacillus thermoaerophilus]
MKNTRRKIAFVVLSIFLFLVGCGEDNKKHQAQVLAFEQELMKAVKQADETATEFSVIADNIKNQKISKEEAVNRLKDLKKDMSRITDKMHATKVDDTLPSDIKDKLSDIKDRMAYAYFQKAKVAGHLATYLENGDSKELKTMELNSKKFEEEIGLVKSDLKEVKQFVGIK